MFVVLYGPGPQIRHLGLFMNFYFGVLPHSIRLALLVTFFCPPPQDVEYSKRGCQFQYRVTPSGACCVLTVEKNVKFNKYLKLKHQRFLSKLSNVPGVRYLVTACVDGASHSIYPVGPGERKLLSFSARLSHSKVAGLIPFCFM